MKGGIVFGYERLSEDKEKIYCVTDDTHSAVIGATRSGKTRCTVLQTIGVLGMADESMLITDSKGELFDYTSYFLENRGYDIRTLDFKDAKKSDRYNFLQPVIDAVNADDIQDAIDKTWDITEALMPDNEKSEPIWKNGEASIIASSILMVVIENKNKYMYQNLANVYRFIIQMAKSRTDEQGKYYILFEKLSEMIERKNPDHPARDILSISEIAPNKTRSSFYTSALTTLRLFTNININSITSDTNINLKDIGRKKVALYIILPDEKETYYSIASLFVHQLYTSLVGQADKIGGALRQRVNFILDEFGNFTKIPNMDNKLTVSGSRNIRFNLFLQSFAQLDEKYGKEKSRIIRYNCENWLYIQTDDEETLKELSGRLGKYTTSSYSISENSNPVSMTSNSSGSSMQLIGRELLTPDEIKKITRPYLLYLSRKLPAIMKCPDISLWNFNKLFSMGDKEHNKRLRFMKNSQRETKIKEIKKVTYWNSILYELEIYVISNKLNDLLNAKSQIKLAATSGNPKAVEILVNIESNISKMKEKLNDLNFKLELEEKNNNINLEKGELI
ncbi:VirD4-like conjugal transfer protein, CD1115 family [Peptoanaerobacter stomatis]